MWWNRGKHPPRFRKWILLEQQKEKIINAVDEMGNFPNEVFQFLSTALGVSSVWYDCADWELLIRAFYLELSKSPNLDLPITTPSNEKQKDEAWDYPSRTWHIYSHLLAKTYGWALEYISQLQVEEALAKIQEIMTDEQLDREFEYGLSEMAYHYDKSTKTSKFVPLPRPHWMRPAVKPQAIPRFKIPVNMLPMGVVVMKGVLPPELMPKEIIQ